MTTAHGTICGQTASWSGPTSPEALAEFIEFNNHQRYHEGTGNVTLADGKKFSSE